MGNPRCLPIQLIHRRLAKIAVIRRRRIGVYLVRLSLGQIALHHILEGRTLDSRVIILALLRPDFVRPMFEFADNLDI